MAFPFVPSPFEPVPTIDELRAFFRKASEQEAVAFINQASGEVLYWVKKWFGITDCPGAGDQNPCAWAVLRRQAWERRHFTMASSIIRQAIREGRIPPTPKWVGVVTVRGTRVGNLDRDRVMDHIEAEVVEKLGIVNGVIDDPDTFQDEKRRLLREFSERHDDDEMTLEEWLDHVNPGDFIDLERCPCQSRESLIEDQELLPNAAHTLLAEIGTGERPAAPVTPPHKQQPGKTIKKLKRGANGQDYWTGGMVAEQTGKYEPADDETLAFEWLRGPDGKRRAIRLRRPPKQLPSTPRSIAELIGGAWTLWGAEMKPHLHSHVRGPGDWARVRGPIEAVDAKWEAALDQEDDADEPPWDVRIPTGRIITKEGAA